MYVAVGLVYGSSYAMVPAHQAQKQEQMMGGELSKKQLLVCACDLLTSVRELDPYEWPRCGKNHYLDCKSEFADEVKKLAKLTKQNDAELYKLIMNTLPSMLRHKAMSDSVVQQIDTLLKQLNIEDDAKKFKDDLLNYVIDEHKPNDVLSLEKLCDWLLIDCCVYKIKSVTDESLLPQYNSLLEELLLFCHNFVFIPKIEIKEETTVQRFGDKAQDCIPKYIPNMEDEKKILDNILEGIIKYSQYGSIMQREVHRTDKQILGDVSSEPQSKDIALQIRELIKNIQQYTLRADAPVNNEMLCRCFYKIWYLLYMFKPVELAKDRTNL